MSRQDRQHRKGPWQRLEHVLLSLIHSASCFFCQDQVGSRSAYLKVRASETTQIVAKKHLARRVRDQWPPAASDVSTDARASLFTAFLADRLTGSRTEWFNESKTGSKPCINCIHPSFSGINNSASPGKLMQKKIGTLQKQSTPHSKVDQAFINQSDTVKS